MDRASAIIWERERLHDMNSTLCRVHDKPCATKSFFPQFNFRVRSRSVEMAQQFVTEMTKHGARIDRQSDCSVRQQQTMKVPSDCWSTFAPVHGNDDKLIECVKQVSLHVAINFLQKNLNEWVAASRRIATPRRTMCDSLKYFRRFWFIGHGACGIYQCKQCMRTMPISWYSISASFRLNQNHLRFFFRSVSIYGIKNVDINIHWSRHDAGRLPKMTDN